MRHWTMAVFVFPALSAMILGCGGDGSGDEDEDSITTVTDATPEECPTGGLTVSTGIDANEDGVLEGDEVDSSYSVCNGADGADGSEGPAGDDGSAGAKGDDGTDGDDGEQGVQGEEGSQGDEGPAASTETYSVGGTVSGLDVGQSVVLQNNGGDDLTLSDNGTFTFDTEVAFGLEFEVTVLAEPVAGRECDVIGGADVAIRDFTDIEIACTPAWTLPTDYREYFNPPGYVDTEDFRVAMDDLGNTLIVWIQDEGDSSDRLYVSEYRAGKWSHSLLSDPIDVKNDHAPDSPEVAMSNDGTAIIVWTENDDTDTRVYYTEYRAGDWSVPAPISPAGQSAADPAVAMDDDGHVVIAWRQSDGTNQQIFAADYDLTSANDWDAPTSLTADHLSIDGQDAAGRPVVAVEDGTAVVAYLQSDGGFDRVHIADYNLATTDAWTSPTNLDTDALSITGGSATAPDVAMDGGAIVVIWQQSDGTNTQLYMADYALTTAAAWTTPASLTDDHISKNGYGTEEPRVVMGGGEVAIVFEQGTNDDIAIFVVEYRDSSWSAGPIKLSSKLLENWEPDVAMNDQGETVVVWSGYPDSDEGDINVVYMAEYRGGSWTKPDSVADFISVLGAAEEECVAFVAMDNNGNAVSVWTENGPEVFYDDGFFNLYMGEYR